jgi:hypothetical protein
MEEVPGDPATLSRRGLTIRLAALAGATYVGSGGVRSASARRRNRGHWAPADGQVDAAGAGDNSSGSNDQGGSDTGTGSSGNNGSNNGSNATGDDTAGDHVVGDSNVGESNSGTNGTAGEDAKGEDAKGEDAVSVVVGPTRSWRRRRS